MSTMIPKYESPGSTTVNRPINLKMNDWVSVMDFIPQGTNISSTDVTSYIQAAHDYIVSTNKAGTLLFPAGTYKCNSGLTINCGWVSCFGERAKLDFTSVGDIACLTFIGGNPSSGNPYSQADFCFNGFEIEGPGQGTGTAFYMNQQTVGSNLGPAHTIWRDFTIRGFKHGIRMGEHAYLMFFDHFDIINCNVGWYSSTTAINGAAIADSGENITFSNGTFFGMDQYSIQQLSGGTDVNIWGCSFDGSGIREIYNNTGNMSITGCHFEGNAQGAIYNGSIGFMTVTGCFFIDNAPSGARGYIYNDGYLTLTGGRIASDRSAGIVYSATRMFFAGCHFQTSVSTANQIVIGSGNYWYWIPNVGNQIMSGGLTAGSVLSDVIGGTSQVVACSVVNTWYAIGYGTRNGMWLYRDTTLGGMAMFVGDSSSGTVQIQNGITGFEMRFNSTDYQIRVTSGTVPRNISLSFFQVTAS